MKNFKQILKEETINDIHESLKKHYHEEYQNIQRKESLSYQEILK